MRKEARQRCPISGEGRKDLRPFVDRLNRPARGSGVIRRDVLENALEPALGFFGPRYFCHERMRRAISSYRSSLHVASNAATIARDPRGR